MDELNSTEEVIKELGGRHATAALTGRKYNAVWAWSKAPHFPADTYVILTKALKAKGKSAPASLWRMTETAE